MRENQPICRNSRRGTKMPQKPVLKSTKEEEWNLTKFPIALFFN
jgi:hypothetical protein